MEAQQIGAKVAQLESRVAMLEDENKIVKGEVKQILTEIRSAILVRDNPFDSANMTTRPAPPTLNIVQSAPAPEPTKLEVIVPRTPEPAPETPRPSVTPPVHDPAPVKEPVMMPGQANYEDQPEIEQPQWSLLTIAGLSAWAEDAVRRVGALRLEILLDLCEASGHLTAESRAALSRVTEPDLPEPTATPSTNETVVILRQLDALVNDEQEHGSARLQRRA